MTWDAASFKEKLDKEHQFPGNYLFKFIVPIQYKNDLLDILPQGQVSFRNSSNNQYISITLTAFMESSDKIVNVYLKAHSISGIIAL